ncbi:MAG: YgiW/YdeI family stress tolerance OB fold protein [Lautropia sp.]
MIHYDPTASSLTTDRRRRSAIAAVAALAFAGALSATHGAAAQYVGPSSVPASDVKTLIDRGRDDQRAVLRGRIVSHEGGDDYTFEDSTGRIRAEIPARRFPANRPIDERQMVELTGKLDRDRNRVEFEVESLRPL